MKILLVVIDTGMVVNPFPMALGAIAAILLKHGYEVEVYSQDYYHYPDEHLTQHLNKGCYDIVGVNAVGGYIVYKRLLSISKAINQAKNRPFYILGGHGPAPEPAYFLRKTQADAVVIGEGEVTIIELLEAIAAKRSFENVKGLAYRNGDEICINDSRPQIQDINSLPRPAYELFPVHFHKLFLNFWLHSTNKEYIGIHMISGRGCMYHCVYCYRLMAGFRPRSNESIIDEIQFLKREYNINFVSFYDELLMTSRERMISLCEEFIRRKLNIKWLCNCRFNVANREVLLAMKRAGCIYANYGMEAMDDQVLKNINKRLTVEKIVKGVEMTYDIGLNVGFNFMFGNKGDSLETLNKAVSFILKYDNGFQSNSIRPVIPFPGTPLYDYAIEKGLLKDCEDFYENKYVNSDLVSVNFCELSDEEVHRALMEANLKLQQHFFTKKLDNAKGRLKKLYIDRSNSFRGFRSA